MSTLEAVNELRLFDYRIQHFDGWQLLVIGDHDLTHHHHVELISTDVQHIHSDIEFYHPKFRDLGPCLCGCTGRRLGIQADRSNFEIISAKLEIVIGNVYHYNRENIEPGERIALWVKQK